MKNPMVSGFGATFFALLQMHSSDTAQTHCRARPGNTAFYRSHSWLSLGSLALYVGMLWFQALCTHHPLELVLLCSLSVSLSSNSNDNDSDTGNADDDDSSRNTLEEEQLGQRC